jgi:pyruvate dehydrogenase E2 component (dihydrolipoyllysine-residue acetyltransferase)
LAKDVYMPSLGIAQETGVLREWLKSDGDNVIKGEPLMEIETDKAVVEIDATASGILAAVTAKPGDEIPVGHVIALILGENEDLPETTSSLSVQTSSTETGQSEQVTAINKNAIKATPVAKNIAEKHKLDLNEVSAKSDRITKSDTLDHLDRQATDNTITEDNRIIASPKARQYAKEKNIDLATLKGSGPDGAIRYLDVENIIANNIVSEAIPMSRKWQIMSDRLTESWQTIPHFYLTTQANTTQLTIWKDNLQQRLEEKITYTDLLNKLVAISLKQHPRINAKWENGKIYSNNDINISLAVAVDGDLLVPVIHNAEQKTITELASRRKELIGLAQENKLSLADMSDGTFTISNLGMFNVDSFNAIVNPPQAAILALGQIKEEVVAVNGQMVIQAMINMTLSCDHRVVDGATGAKFLHTLASLIEDPMQTLD